MPRKRVTVMVCWKVLGRESKGRPVVVKGLRSSVLRTVSWALPQQWLRVAY